MSDDLPASDDLRVTAPPPAPVTAPPPAPAAAPGGAIGPEGWTPPTAPAPTKRRFPRGLIIGAVIVAVLVGAGIIGRDFLSGNASDLRVGDCFDDPIAAGSAATEVEDVQHHPCAEAHLFEVFAVFDFPAEKGTAFPGNSGFDTFTTEKCTAAFADYVGITVESSSMDWSDYQPIAKGWDSGDREITCFLANQDLSKQTGSAKGSKR